MTASHSDALVFFGATGDLAYKQIFPALQAMIRHGHLNLPIIGVAKSGLTVHQLRERARDSIQNSGTFDAGAFARLSAQLIYIDGDYQDDATYAQIRSALGQSVRPLYYLAIPPSMFEPVTLGLAKSGGTKNARVIVEKPFGRDLASAQALNQMLHTAFEEDAIFRIDHYLGKEAVENLLYFRFSNTFVEPIWHRDYVASVQITMAEKFGVQGRGAFYEEVGAIRDVVQNHMLQVMALLTMEMPIADIDNHTGDAPVSPFGAWQEAGKNTAQDAIRDEKCRVLSAMRPLLLTDLVRGQFQGYRDEPGVASDSQVETFAALKLHIDNPRWQDVPFYIRAGKQLPVTCTEIVVELKPPPSTLFDKTGAEHPNYFLFRLSPDFLIALGTRTKLPGEAMVGMATPLIAHRQPGQEMTPYERLLGDALQGNSALFTRGDMVEAAWRVVDPVLNTVTISTGQTKTMPVISYAPGTWGPEAAEQIMDTNDGWHNPALKDTPP
ncbi:glucose-6-phosphate dehydrogenase [Glaciimonas immobilis]|uniref:Glucose-6-phosphate 1-dehydrogenase n=1 Tax=Glaciimonas immobilis TaxID=728004 RepID=A0A840RZM3_9BURK|nr:glucose-6-phosphate dehydrogenase (NADP(+)) [Glaciimonas immobilis]KAF3998320.1 glucose-6-phosphate dehydrogenase (NADP(+)) [Glaciimonas immobilis]MBB5201941.1 glucose-6-phosphate 1-dehydrogenase [Glaciimonas immobilis]